jgi:16S rRNA processing protein RimM
VTAAMTDLVAIARIARPHGLKGEAVADVLTDFPERFEGLVDITAIIPDGTRRQLKIERARFQKDRVILQFEGIGRLEDIEPLRGADICISEEEAVELEEDEFFDWELEGCRVVTIDGTELGNVASVLRTGGTEVLVVKGTEKELLIPFAQSICVEVDIENGRITVDPPEGLLEF